jgi:hypothetical protein
MARDVCFEAEEALVQAIVCSQFFRASPTASWAAGKHEDYGHREESFRRKFANAPRQALRQRSSTANDALSAG